MSTPQHSQYSDLLASNQSPYVTVNIVEPLTEGSAIPVFATQLVGVFSGYYFYGSPVSASGQFKNIDVVRIHKSNCSHLKTEDTFELRLSEPSRESKMLAFYDYPELSLNVQQRLDAALIIYRQKHEAAMAMLKNA